MTLHFVPPVITSETSSDVLADIGYGFDLVRLGRIWRVGGAYETFAYGHILRRHVSVFELVDRLWVGAEFLLRREFVGPLDLRPLLVSRPC